MKTNLKNKNGTLTVYGFACGYIEQVEHAGIRTTLWLEHGSWHVRQHDFNEHKRLSWECFERLGAARKYFNKIKM